MPVSRQVRRGRVKYARILDTSMPPSRRDAATSGARSRLRSAASQRVVRACGGVHPQQLGSAQQAAGLLVTCVAGG
jgi:hypothetical protein